jgi:putative protease
MKIIAPIAEIKEVVPVIEAGADEVYCGICPQEWAQNYKGIDSSNRRHCYHASLKGYQELASVIEIAHAMNVRVNVALNEFYSKSQYPLLLKQVGAIFDLEPDMLVIADIGLLSALKEKKKTGTDLCMSVVGSTFNSSTASFYKRLGVSRIVLPREIRPAEIKEIVSNTPGVEFETIILNCKCKFIEGFCSFQHGLGFTEYDTYSRLLPQGIKKGVLNRVSLFMAQRAEKYIIRNTFGCSLDYRILRYQETTSQEKENWVPVIKGIFNKPLNGCGACSIPSLEAMGITFAKITGRENHLKKKIKDVRFIKSAVDVLPAGMEEARFCKKMKQMYANTYHKKCVPAYCYYK